MSDVKRFVVPQKQAWDVATLTTPKLEHESFMVLASDYDALAARVAEMEKALEEAERFISGFEGDPTQYGIDELLASLRALIPAYREQQGGAE